jgi:hypothetical protein
MREELAVPKAVLPWWAAGLLLGLIQVLAVGLYKPLGVSTQFVVADTQVLERVAPAYVSDHPLIGAAKYRVPGYGWWLDVGLVVGAVIAALAVRRWRLRGTTVWWRANHGTGVAGRMIAGFAGGFLILLGARFAHGCTSGQFMSGWSQLSLSVVPFTVALFGFGMLTAWIVHRKTPRIEK